MLLDAFDEHAETGETEAFHRFADHVCASFASRDEYLDAAERAYLMDGAISPRVEAEVYAARGALEIAPERPDSQFSRLVVPLWLQTTLDERLEDLTRCATKDLVAAESEQWRGRFRQALSSYLRVRDAKKAPDAEREIDECAAVLLGYDRDWLFELPEMPELERELRRILYQTGHAAFAKYVRDIMDAPEVHRAVEDTVGAAVRETDERLAPELSRVSALRDALLEPSEVGGWAELDSAALGAALGEALERLAPMDQALADLVKELAAVPEIFSRASRDGRLRDAIRGVELNAPRGPDEAPLLSEAVAYAEKVAQDVVERGVRQAHGQASRCEEPMSIRQQPEPSCAGSTRSESAAVTHLAAVVREAPGAVSERLLEALLAAWRRHRTADLADAVETVSAELAKATYPDGLPGKRIKDKNESFFRLVSHHEPPSLGPLLSFLCAGSSKLAIERLRALQSWPQDPRIGRHLARLVARPPFQSRGTNPFWKLAFSMLPRHADPRVVELLAPLAGRFFSESGGKGFSEMMERELAAALPQCGEALESAPPLADDEQSLVEEMVALALAPIHRRLEVEARAAAAEADLLAGVYRDPDSDDARLAYMECLGERNDPRAEFIALQYERHRDGMLSPRKEKRERALARKHASSWVGELAPVLTLRSARFERGFLDTCELHPGKGRRNIAALVGHPAWSTVRHLHGSTCRTVPAAFYSDPVFRRLRTLDGVSLGAALAVAQGEERHLEQLSFSVMWGEALTDEARDVLGAAAPLPSLKSLTVGTPMEDGDPLRWWLESPVARRLEELSLVICRDGALATVARALQGRSETPLSRVRLQARGITFALERIGGEWCRLRVESRHAPASSLAAVLEPLPPDLLTHLDVAGTLTGGETDIARLAAWAQSQIRLEHVVLPSAEDLRPSR